MPRDKRPFPPTAAKRQKTPPGVRQRRDPPNPTRRRHLPLPHPEAHVSPARAFRTRRHPDELSKFAGAVGCVPRSVIVYTGHLRSGFLDQASPVLFICYEKAVVF
ncbi:hypothetical protein MRX96_055070 [Rhipicephalus microplus]